MKKIAIIGSGLMGHGIGQLYATYGKTVVLYDVKQEALENAEKRISDGLDVMVEKDIITLADKNAAIQRISYTTDLINALIDADMVVEVIPEVLDLKLEMYEKVEAAVSKDTIITSNTSALPLTDLTRNAKHPERFFITHFFAPPQLIPLVEIIKLENYREDLLQEIVSFLKVCGKSPIVLKKEVPGFIANRIQMAILKECFWLYENDIATAEDIDTVMKDSLGFRYVFLGPLEGQDIAGLNTPYYVSQTLFPVISDTKEPPKFLKKMIDENKLGIRTNEGFYSYGPGEVDRKLKERDEHFLDVYLLKQKTKR